MFALQSHGGRRSTLPPNPAAPPPGFRLPEAARPGGQSPAPKSRNRVFGSPGTGCPRAWDNRFEAPPETALRRWWLPPGFAAPQGAGADFGRLPAGRFCCRCSPPPGPAHTEGFVSGPTGWGPFPAPMRPPQTARTAAAAAPGPPSAALAGAIGSLPVSRLCPMLQYSFAGLFAVPPLARAAGPETAPGNRVLLQSGSAAWRPVTDCPRRIPRSSARLAR